jgi:hypothetical protein
MRAVTTVGIVCTVLVAAALAQRVEVRAAMPVSFPSETDSNSPTFWYDGQMVIYNSTGLVPVRSEGPGQFQLGASRAVVLGPSNHKPYWIEAAWVDEDGSIFAWYHHEPSGVCKGSRLTAPQIGALISRDGGRSYRDLGIVLSSGYGVDCSSQNGYFAGGNGDFTVVLGQRRQYFYFLFSNYGGPVEQQGVAIARMRFDLRNNPSGAVQKYYGGQWMEPGLGGRVSPVFAANAAWNLENADSFWGPSVHWNTYLQKFVMLLNRSCCAAGWPQEGVYVSFNSTLSNPESWSEPAKILDGVPWYPQVLGLGPNETDTLAGRVARLYVYGHSNWKLVFHRESQSRVDGSFPPASDPH